MVATPRIKIITNNGHRSIKIYSEQTSCCCKEKGKLTFVEHLPGGRQYVGTSFICKATPGDRQYPKDTVFEVAKAQRVSNFPKGSQLLKWNPLDLYPILSGPKLCSVHSFTPCRQPYYFRTSCQWT